MTSTDQDRACASLARASLFPKRMHRDAADDSHFPALLQLDLLRDSCLQSLANASISSIFPRHVVVVRNLANGGTQWNGVPDFEDAPSVSFSVIPDLLSVRCTSNCDQFLTSKSQRAFQRPTVDTGSGNSTGQEIVLCSDRILQRDSRNAKYKGVAKELPPKSLQAVEEVLAHQLVRVRRQKKESDKEKETAQIEVEAAQAAECYFSRHTYDGQKKIKKGSRLQTGYSLLPFGFLQGWSMSKCLSVVATEHLVAQSMSSYDAKQAVQAAMKNQK